MSLEKCPICGEKSLIKTPRARVMTESLGVSVHTSNEHSMDCLYDTCDYTSGVIRVNTPEGDRRESPWYKRIFN